MIRAALVTLALMALAPRAFADAAKADALATEATAAAAANDYKTAARKFSEANREDPRPSLFCNIGISYFKVDEYARAHLLLNICLERSSAVLESGVVDNVRAVLSSIEQTMRAGKHTPVSFDADPNPSAISIEDWGTDEVFTTPRTVWLPFGTFHLTAHVEGYRDEKITVVTDKPAPQKVPIKLHKASSEITNPPPHTTTRRPGSKVPPIVATVATAGVLVFSLLATSKAQSKADDAALALDQGTFDDDHDSAKSWNRISQISGGVAIAGAALSGILWYRAIRGTEVPLEVAPSPTGGTVSYRVRF